MIKMQLFPFELPFKHPFGISRDTKTTQPLIVVQLEFNGVFGLGEATTNRYYDMTPSKLKSDLETIRPILKNIAFETPEKLWQRLYPELRDNLFALCAIDIAVWDIYAKLQRKKLYEVWGLDISKNPLTDYTIGIDSIDNMVIKIKEFPWPIYKIKLGTTEDIEIVKALRQETDSVFRIDANCAWTLKETIDNSFKLKDLGVEFIEQPMPDPKTDKKGWEDLKTAYKESALPIIADENCIIEADVDKCHNYFHGINIKLVKCGGLTPALRMIKKAKEYNMKLMVGSMNESTTGSSAAAHLLPFLDYFDMDGPLLQAEDTATGISYNQGKIIYANRPGTGAELIRSF